MNLGKVEKIIIAVLVVGAIIGFGIFLFIVMCTEQRCKPCTPRLAGLIGFVPAQGNNG